MPIFVGDSWWAVWLPRWFRRWLRWLFLAPPQPGPLTIHSQQEATVLRYTIKLPAKPAIADLATREVTIALDAKTDVWALLPDTADFVFDTDVGVLVSITLIDIDTSGNRSAPSPALTFTATDTVPPPVPGGLAVANVEQIDTPPAKKK